MRIGIHTQGLPLHTHTRPDCVCLWPPVKEAHLYKVRADAFQKGVAWIEYRPGATAAFRC